MANTRLSDKALYVERGYGQVEPNHLSAQRNGKIYAQLPAAATITVLENGQFAKYNYAAGVVDFVGKGEWMLVLNEVKVYHDYESDNDFALKAADYNARVYAAGAAATGTAKAIDLGIVNPGIAPDGTSNPGVIEQYNAEAYMPTGTTMVPRLFKTDVGDIFTTNTIAETSLAVGDLLSPNASGYLAKFTVSDDNPAPAMQWEVVKVYTLADRQKAVKIMRIA